MIVTIWRHGTAEDGVNDRLRKLTSMGRDDVGLDEIRDALEKVGLLDVLLRRPEGMNLRLTVGARR